MTRSSIIAASFPNNLFRGSLSFTRRGLAGQERDASGITGPWLRLDDVEPLTREPQRRTHPLQNGLGIRGAERPRLELQAHGPGIPTRPEGDQERSQGEPSLARQAVLVTACLQVRVGQVDVTKLGREDRVGPEDVDLAGPGVAGVERDF